MDKQIIKLFIAVTFIIASISSAFDSSENKKIAELETRVKEILARDNISQRPDVNDVFELADIYASQGNSSKAREMYEKGLSIDSFRFEYQLKCANLMRKSGDANQAIEKYKSVYAYCEDENLINTAKEQLLDLKVDCPKPSQKEGKLKIVVVPIGNLNSVFVDELLSRLNQETGIKYTLWEKQIPPGRIDRTYAAQYLSGICENIRKEFPEIKPPDDTDPFAQLQFIINMLRKDGVPKKDIENFRTSMMNDFKDGQRNADRFIAELYEQFNSVKEDGTAGYLGITESDIYSNDNNFLFGWGRTRFAVMSYCRFKGDFNKEPQNRPRLVERSLKQCLSSTFFMLNIPRCTSAMCARAYANNLEEHDLKETKLCSWCKEQLSKKITNK